LSKSPTTVQVDMSALIGAIGSGAAALSQLVIIILILGVGAAATWSGLIHLVVFVIAGLLTGLRLAQLFAGGEESFYKKNAKAIRIATIVLGSISAVVTGVIFASILYGTITAISAYGSVVAGVEVWIVVILGAVAFIGHLVNSCVACCCNGDAE